jgi:hypothetical protein
LTGQRTINAAEFCGFADVAMSPVESFGWCVLALILPFFMPFFPFLMIGMFKTHPVWAWRKHVRNKQITGYIGKATYWGYTGALCGLTERYIRSDPTILIPDNQEVQWSFGQILSIMMLIPIFVELFRHMAKMPWYPIPEFQPSNSRLTFYLHLFLDCSSRFDNVDSRSREVEESWQVYAIVRDGIFIQGTRPMD